MSKKNNKNNKKKSTRKNYKIESLEPRLMMDATLDGWVEEANLVYDSSNGATNDNLKILKNSTSSAWTNSFVETVQRKDTTKGEYEQCKVSDVIEAGLFDEAFKTARETIKQDFQDALIKAIEDKLVANSVDFSNKVSVESQKLKYNGLFLPGIVTNPTKFSKLKNLVLETMVGKDVESQNWNSFKELFVPDPSWFGIDWPPSVKTNFDNFVNEVKKNCDLNDSSTSTISAIEILDKWTTTHPGYTVQLSGTNDGLSFGITKNLFASVKQLDTFRTDITDFSGVSVNLGLVDTNNVSFSGQMHVEFDGADASLERNEIDSMSVNTYFRELNDTPADKNTNFGFGTMTDPSESRTTANGKALGLTSSGAGLYTAGVDSNGNATHFGDLYFDVDSFTDLNSINPSTFINKSIRYFYDSSNKKWDWLDGSGNIANDITKLENFRIGPVMQKLSNLSYWLHENSTVTPSNPKPLLADDFGGLLAQNVSEIAQLSSLLDCVLSSTPRTLQDLVKIINTGTTPALPGLYNNHTQRNLSINGNDLILHFELNGNDISRNVSLLTQKLKDLGFEVIENYDLQLDVTERTLKFDLVVPLDGSLDIGVGDKLVYDPKVTPANFGVLDDIEPTGLGNVVGAAYVTATNDVDRFSFESYSIPVDSLKQVTIAATSPTPLSTKNCEKIEIKFKDPSKSLIPLEISIDGNDNANSIMKKIVNKIAGDPAFNKGINCIEIETHEDEDPSLSTPKEYLLFTLKDRWSLDNTITRYYDSSSTTSTTLSTSPLTINQINQYDGGDHYELLNSYFFSEDAIDCIYYDFNVLTHNSNDNIEVNFEYNSVSLEKGTFRSDNLEDCLDGIVALIANHEKIKEDNIQVKIIKEKISASGTTVPTYSCKLVLFKKNNLPKSHGDFLNEIEGKFNTNISIKIGGHTVLSGTSSNQGYLYTSNMLPVNCSSWFSTTSENLTITLDNSGPSVLLQFNQNDLENANSLDDIVKIINDKIEASSWNDKVICETRKGKITFRVVDYKNYSSVSVSGSLYDDLGFDSALASATSQPGSNQCLEVTLCNRNNGRDDTVCITLDSIDATSTVQDVIDAIVYQCNTQIGCQGIAFDSLSGRLVGINGYDIKSIKNINDCTIGSVLGIVGEAKDGCVFRVSGINKTKAKNGIELENLLLDAKYSVRGFPYINANLGNVNSQFFSQYAMDLLQINSSIFPLLFEHKTSFSMSTKMADNDIISLPGLLDQCNKKLDKLMEDYVSSNYFELLMQILTNYTTNSTFNSEEKDVITLKNLVFDVFDRLNEIIEAIKSFDEITEKFSPKAVIDPYVMSSLDSFKAFFENFIEDAKIENCLVFDSSSVLPLDIKNLLDKINNWGLFSALSTLDSMYNSASGLKSIILTDVANARLAANSELNSCGAVFNYSNTTFNYSPTSYNPTATAPTKSLTIENFAGVLVEAFALSDLAALKKQQDLDSSIVPYTQPTGLPSEAVVLSESLVPGLSSNNRALNETDVKILDQLENSKIFEKVANKFINVPSSGGIVNGLLSNFADYAKLNISLPILGRSFDEICGASAAIKEIQNFFQKNQSMTLQDMQFALKEIGVDCNVLWIEPTQQPADYGKGVIRINLSKALNVFSQKIQLDKIFEIKGLHLGGCLEAYLDIVASINLNIEIGYEYHVDPTTGEKILDLDEPKFTGGFYSGKTGKYALFHAEVSLRVPSASADLNVHVGNFQSPKMKIVNDGEALTFSASCDIGLSTTDDKNVEIISMSVDNFTGKLGVEMNGTRLGKIEFGINGTNSVDVKDWSEINPCLVLNQPFKDFLKNEFGEDYNDGSSRVQTSKPTKDFFVDVSFLDVDSFEEFDLFEKLRLVTDGLSESLRKIQSGINKQVLSKTMRDIPFIGDKIVSVADCITRLDGDFIEPFRNFVYNAKGMTAESVSEKLYLMLKRTGLLKDLVDINPGVSIPGVTDWAGKEFTNSYNGIHYYSGPDEAGWHIKLGGSLVLDSNADFDIGMPGLGLRADGGLRISIEWSLDIGFGVSQNDGAFLLFDDGNDFTVNLTVGKENDQNINNLPVNGLTINGSLGFLTMDATVNRFSNGANKPSLNIASLGIDLNSKDTTTTGYAIPVSSLGSRISIDSKFSAGVDLSLDLTLGAGEMFPSIGSDFVFKWKIGDNVVNNPGIQYIAFEKLTLDAGEFIDKMFGGIFKKVKKVLEPIQPLIDFLQSEIPVLNKLPAGAVHITVLDLIKQFGKGKMNFGFLDDIIQLNQIAKMFGTSSSGGILLNLPDLVLYEGIDSYESGSQTKRNNINDASRTFLSGFGQNIDDYINKLMSSFDVKKSNGLSALDKYTNAFATDKDYSGKTSSDYFNELKNAFKGGGLSVESRLDVKQAGPISTDPYGWQFPLIQNPISQVVGLLMGRPADLVTYHMHPLEFNFNWANSYPIVGPLCADIGFNFGVCFDLKFGYDTLGMVKWKESHYKDYSRLLDGFYIADWDSKGKDIAEIVFHSGVVAGASVAGRAGINVALDLNVNLNFNDPNNDGKIRLREMAQMIKKPISMFDVSATIEMEAYAYLDYFIGRKKWVLWSSGAFELFDTAKTYTKTVEMVSDLGDDKVVNIGEYAANRGVGDMSDGKDNVTVTVTERNKIYVSWTNEKNGAHGEGEGKIYDNQTLYIYAGEEIDTITFTCNSGIQADFNIVIFAGKDNDIIDLSGLNFAGTHSATVYGGDGSDDIKGATSGLNYLFGDVGYTTSAKDDKKILSAYYDDESVGVNTIHGGENASNFIFGGFGKDTIYAGKTDVDYIFGDGGCVEIKIDGKDITVTDVRAHDLYDEGGDDDIYGGIGIDHIYGGAGKDFIDANAGNDVIYGGKGHDVIFGRAGDDEIHGGDGVDIIFGDAPYKDELLIASRNDNSINGETPIIPWQVVSEELKKDVNNAQYLRTPKLKSRNAQCGSDRIYGDNGSDIIFGDNGRDDNSGANDIIYGGAGNDFIDGDGGDDNIYGDSGEDVIYGGLGNDVIDGGADNDVVFGDNGLNGYTTTMVGEDLFSKSENEDDAKKVFGDALVSLKDRFMINNLGLQSNLFSETGDADLIYAGNDSDFVDGQGGNDTYKISFMGGFYSAYTNVMDSGKNDDNDSMSVEGTFENDNLLVRNSNFELGMIALLPDTNDSNDESTENASDNQYKYEKKKIERINYWVDSYNRGIEQISLNAGAGDDKIAVDGTLSVLSIDAGAGDDSITVGQLFESERVRDVDDSVSDLQVRYENAKANVAEMDVFGTTLTSQGYLSNGVEHPTTITGGLGNDTFNVLHASAAVALMGGEGSDTFNVATFQRVDLQGNLLGVLQNAPVTLIGGVGDDKMNVVGSDGDDTFVVSGGSIQSSGVDIQAVSIENQDVFGGAGDDSFYVLDTIDGSMTHLYGNDGNDSFYNGGNQSEDAYIVVDNEDYKGHSGIIEHEVEAVNTDKYRQKKTAAISVNIRDNDVEKNSVEPVEVLFVDNQNNIIEPSAIIEEGDSAQTVYYLALSRNLKDNETITVNVYAPSLSAEDIQRGNRGFVFIDANNNEQKTLSVTFTKDDCDAKAVTIKAIGDNLVEGNDYFALLHKVVSSTTSCKPCRNAVLFFKDKLPDGITTKQNVENHFVRTEEHVVSADDIAKNKSNKRIRFDLKANASIDSLTMWCDNENIQFEYDVQNSFLWFSWKNGDLPVGSKIYISYMDVGMIIDNDCIIQMQYDTSMISTSDYLVYSYQLSLETIIPDVTSLKLDHFTYDSNANTYTLDNGFIGDPFTYADAYFVYCQEYTVTANSWELHKDIILSNGIIFGDASGNTYEASYGKFLGLDYYFVKNGNKITIKKSSDDSIVTSVSSICYTTCAEFNMLESEFKLEPGDSILSCDLVKNRLEYIPQMGVDFNNNRYYYKKAGTQLIICDAKSGQPVSVSGSFYFRKKINDQWEMELPKVSIPDEPDPNTVTTFDKLYDEEGLGRVVITQSGNSTDVSEGKINNQEVTDSYAISLSGPKLTGNEMVKVKINPLETPVFTNGVATDNSVVQVKILGVKLYDNTNTEVNPSEDFFEKDGNGNIVAVIFNSSNYDGYFVVTVVGNDDGYVESDSPKLIALGENTIENIKGALYEDGAGRMPDLDLHSPMIVHYRPKGSTSDEKNETSDEFAAIKETLAEKQKSIDEYASVDRVFVNNMDNVKDGAVSSLKALDDANVDPAVKTRIPVKINDGDPLSLKIEKSDSELYNSDKFSLRMNHSDVSASGINFGNMEYAEINLGKGTDKVDVYKTVYRDDAFQTFTVINSGSGNNEIKIATCTTWEKDEEFVDSENGSVKYNISQLQYEDDFESFMLENQRVFVKVKYTDDSIQYREVLIDTSSSTSLTLKQDLTTVDDGVEIDSISLVTNLLDDDIVIHSYAKESFSTIASWTDWEKVDDYEGSVDGAVKYSVNQMNFNAGFGQHTFYDYVQYNNNQTFGTGLLSSVHRVFVNVEYTDGSIQRREVLMNASSSLEIVLTRDLTPVAEGVSIKSVTLIADASGDGMLVVNAQGGDDKIDAMGDTDENNASMVTREDLVVIGGVGDDTIDVNTNAIAFGDRGMVEFVNEDNEVVTRLGSTDDIDVSETDAVLLDKADYTTPTNKDISNYFQTDGVIRDPNTIKSMSDNVGGNDTITTHGDKNVAIGGAGEDLIHLNGNNNVAIGDNGEVLYESSFTDANNNTIHNVYGDSHRTYLHYVQTTSDTMGDKDEITTGDGNNVVMGGTNSDRIATGNGNDIIIGDGGEAFVDRNREALFVSNQGRNIDTDDNGVIKEDGSAGSDVIKTSGGDNVIFGGLNTVSRDFDFVKNSEIGKWETESVDENNNDLIVSGSGKDIVFGDNAYATFKGNHEMANGKENAPEVRDSATLSFNFQGAAQTGLNSSDSVGAEGFATTNWNNISGSIAGAYGNDDSEIVRFDDGTRASSISVSYAGIEWHRNTSTDNRINLQAYNLGLHGTSYDANKKFMNTGLMTTAPNNQCASRMEVAVDGLAQYYESYQVAVYLDLPDANSWAGQSVRLISLYIDGVRKQAFYVNDPEHVNFSGTYVNNGMEAVLDANGHIQGVQVLEDGEIKIKPMDNTIGSGLAPSNYVVFDVGADIASDRIVIKIEDGVKEWNLNGKDLPGIAGLQIKGTLHKQDVAASTNIEFGGNDVIHSNCGDDIIVGGTGADKIWSFDEDDRHGINDNDVVFGDNAKLLFTDRDSNENTASTLSTAESISVTADNISHCEKNDSTGNELEDAFKYHDEIYTGDGNDVVVGGIGGDTIHTNATANSERMMDNINVLSINFTREHSDASDSIAAGEAAGVVVDNGWHNFYRNDRGVIVSDTAYSQSQSNMNAYNEAMNRLCNSPDSSNPYAVSEGVEVHMYGKMNGQRQGPSSFTIENHDEIDGDTSNSKLYNTYIASQQSEEIVLKLLNLNTFVGNSGNTIDTTSYDLYVYLGGDNNDTDTYNYLYQISLNTGDGSPTQYRYLNDWTGHKFDGDYKEAYCTSYAAAWSALHDFATPRIEIIGNYVVFRNVTGNVADIRIKNVISFSGQSPKNLPMITAIQIVSGDGRYKESDNGPLVFNEKHYEYADIAIGGDHDKDLVYGDDAKLWFDLDVPFATDENIANYRNRVIEAKSVAIDQGVVTRVSTNDFIQTGKDRDVVVGGEDGDTIITGLGDDVALGGSANLMVEHNNPLGVFTPNTEIVLDQHTIDLNIHRGYLDNDNTNVNQIQYQLNQNQILGIDKSVPNGNDRYDSIDAGSGRNLTYQSSDSNAALIVTPPPAPTPGPSEGGEGQGQGTGEGQGQGSSSSTGEGQGTSSSSGSGSTEMRVETLTGSPQVLTLNAGETIKLVCTEYPQGNQWWTPNVVIYGNNAGNSTIPEIDWAWDGGIKAHTNVGNNVRIDIPDHPNGANGEYEIYLTARTSGMVILYVGQG